MPTALAMTKAMASASVSRTVLVVAVRRWACFNNSCAYVEHDIGGLMLCRNLCCVWLWSRLFRARLAL